MGRRWLHRAGARRRTTEGHLAFAGTQPPSTNLDLNLTGTATDDVGVKGVRVALRDADTGLYAKEGGGTQAQYTTIPATVASPGETSTGWSLPFTLPSDGDWNVTAVAFDAAGQYDFSSTGATARYLAYPGDTPPTFNMGLLAPTDGTTFSDGKIFVSGRAEDNQSMAKVEVAIHERRQPVHDLLRFVHQQPDLGQLVPDQPRDGGVELLLHLADRPGGQLHGPGPRHRPARPGDDRPARSIRDVTQPANNKPVAVQLDPVCTQNVCQFDARSSTDENAATLSYSWNYGVSTPGGIPAGTATGPNPKKTFTSPGTYTVTLTAKDQWGLTSDPVTKTVTINEPPGNAAPTPVINPPACSGLTCNFSAVGTVDPDTGDTITYAWNFGDPTTGVNNNRTGAAASHVFSAPGTYTVTLTATDGWGNTATVPRSVTVTAPESLGEPGGGPFSGLDPFGPGMGGSAARGEDTNR